MDPKEESVEESLDDSSLQDSPESLFLFGGGGLGALLGSRLGGRWGLGLGLGAVWGAGRGFGGWGCTGGAHAAMKQRILGYRTPPCHRRPVIATQSSISSSYCALITTGMFHCVPAHRSALLTKHQYYSTSKSSTSSDPQHEDLNFVIIAA